MNKRTFTLLFVSNFIIIRRTFIFNFLVVSLEISSRYIVLVETTDTRLKYSFTVMIIYFYGKYWIISIVLR